ELPGNGKPRDHYNPRAPLCLGHLETCLRSCLQARRKPVESPRSLHLENPRGTNDNFPPAETPRPGLVDRNHQEYAWAAAEGAPISGGEGKVRKGARRAVPAAKAEWPLSVRSGDLHRDPRE